MTRKLIWAATGLTLADVTGIAMVTAEPRQGPAHFWANDDAIKLARGLRAALDKTASTKS
jgi:hypothetical protein